MTLSIQSTDAGSRAQFQSLLKIEPGFNRLRTTVQDIVRLVNLKAPFGIELIPNDIEDGVTLYFGLMDFVREMRQPSRPDKVKCIVWDLDNTLWDGILVEDGGVGLRLKPKIFDVIERLDRRGILHSIASKNNYEDAIAVLRRFNLAKYFLAAQISWEPKSESLRRIARALNISLDSMLFVDDSRFEREEVVASCPGIRVLDATYFELLTKMDVCDVPVTEESANRRYMYQVELERQIEAKDFGHDYIAFLRYCNIRLRITSLSNDNLQRVHELAQRTNQMNFSGNRYDQEVLKGILSTP